MADAITPQTLGMYYYGFSKLMKKAKGNQDKVFSSICSFLASDQNPMFNEEEEASEDFQFMAGLQVTGLITYSLKHVRAGKLDKNHMRLITKTVDQRLHFATRAENPILLNAYELISLKLLAIGLAKDQATNWGSI